MGNFFQMFDFIVSYNLAFINITNLSLFPLSVTLDIFNCIFTNTSFNMTVFDIGFFKAITMQNIWFINNLIFSGINIHNGNNFSINLDSIKFIQNTINYNLINFSSINSNIMINDLQIYSNIYYQNGKLIYNNDPS